MLGTYGEQPSAVALYAGTLVLTGLVVLTLWLYATSGRRLVRPDLGARLIQHHAWRVASVPVVFLVSIWIAQVSPLAAELSWSLIAVALVVLRWIYADAD